MLNNRLIPILFFVSFFFTPFPGLTQNTQQLKTVLTDANRPDTTRLRIMNTLITGMLESHSDSALVMAKEQLQLAEKLKLKKHIAHAYYNIAYAYENKNEFILATDFYQKSLSLWKELNNEKEQASCYTNIGILYEYQSNYPKALENYLNALSISEKIGDKKAIGFSNNDIGVIFLYQKNYSKALDYSFKGLKILEEIGHRRGMTISYSNIGTVYSKQKRFKEAELYFLKVLKIREEDGDKKGIAGAYNNIAGNYSAQGLNDKCLEYLEQYLKISKELDDKQSIGMAYVNIGILYYKTENFKKALRYCDTALSVGLEIGDTENQRIAWQYKANALNKLGKYKEAFDAHVKFKILTDSIFNIDNSRQLSDLRTSYEVDKKETELRIQHEKEQAVAHEEAKKQRVILFAVAGFAVLGLLLAAVIFRNLRLNKRKNRIISEQKRLVEEKQKEIIDSIHYARRIQSSLLPTEKYIEKILKRKP